MRQSPKESATTYNVGIKKKGLDGNMWKIKKMESGIKRWIKVESKLKEVTKTSKKDEERNELEKKLAKKLYKWWIKLSNGSIIVIFKDGKSKLYKSNKVTKTANFKETHEKWKEYGNDKNVDAIIFSSISEDNIQQFVYYLLYKLSKAELTKLLDQKNIPEYIIENYKKYFKKNKINTNKDYTFKMYYPPKK
jgi:hypothetical protein